MTFWVQGWSERFGWLLVRIVSGRLVKMPLRPPVLKLESQFNLGSLALFWFTGWIQLTHMFPSLGSPVPLDLCKTGPYGTYRTGVETQVVLSLFLCQRRDTEHLWLQRCAEILGSASQSRQETRNRNTLENVNCCDMTRMTTKLGFVGQSVDGKRAWLVFGI